MLEEYSTSSTPYDFTIESVIITADRWEFALEGIDIKNVCAEINLFEHLDKPYLTANLTFLDNANIGDNYQFTGTERVQITLISSDERDDAGKNTIVKRFIVDTVVNAAKSNDSNELVVLHLVEERYYQSCLMSVNKVFKKIESRGGFNEGGFTSSATEIIQSLLRELDQYTSFKGDYYMINELMHNKEFPPEFDGALKVCIPNLGVLDAVKWMCDRCVTPTGFPFYIYATMADDKIRFLDLDSMLNAATLNNKNSGLMPYTYSQALMHKANTLPPAAKSFIISNYQNIGGNSQHSLNQKGMGPATFNFIDTFRGTIHVKKHNPGDTFRRAFGVGILKDDDVPVYDDKAEFGGRNIDDYSARTITNITTSKSQSGSKLGIDDQNRNYNEVLYTDSHNIKITAKAYRNYLHKSSIAIEVPGRNFISKDNNISIGNRILVEFRKNENDTNAYGAELDIKKSGEYLIYSARHSFSPGGDGAMISNLQLVKLAHRKR